MDEDTLKDLKVAEDDPRLDVRVQFETEMPIIKNLMKQNGEDAEEYAMAFDFMSAIDTSLTQDILELPREERISAIVAKGKEMVDDYKIIKEKGNLKDTFKAIREQAVEDYKESLKADTKQDEPKTVKTKSTKRPKMKGTSEAQPKAKKDMSLTGILGK